MIYNKMQLSLKQTGRVF